jgi:regulator of replication initiation timing
MTIEQRQKQVISRLTNENKKLRIENRNLRLRLT